MKFFSSHDEVLSILIVEDNSDHAELIKRGLEEYGLIHDLALVNDGESAVEYLLGRGMYSDREKYRAPHLVLLDLRLPRLGGLEVLKKIRTTTHLEKLRVVILTTSDVEKDVARAYSYRADAYLVKPTCFEKFQTLLEVIGFYGLLRKPELPDPIKKIGKV